MNTTLELKAPDAIMDGLCDIFKEGSAWAAHTAAGITYAGISTDIETGRTLHAFADATGHIAVISRDVNPQGNDVYTVHATGQQNHVLVEPTVSQLVAEIAVSIAMSQAAAQRNKQALVCGQ